MTYFLLGCLAFGGCVALGQLHWVNAYCTSPRVVLPLPPEQLSAQPECADAPERRAP